MRRMRRMIVVLTVLGLFVSLAAVAVATNITLDGDFSDWSGETPLMTDLNEPDIPDKYDIGNAYATVNDSGLQHFIAYTTTASMQINPASAVDVWYDTDANVATGYPLGPIGAERQLAWRMDRDTCELSEWDDANSEWDLLATDCDGAPSSGIGTNKGTFVELGADTADLGVGGTGKLDICMLFENADFNGYRDDTICFTHEWGNGGEGCTPGYWRQPQHLDYWVNPPYDPDTSFDVVFGVDCSSGKACQGKTLHDAVWARGGGENALMRHAVAALLNAAADSGVSYKYSVEQVIAMVQHAYATGDFQTPKDDLVAQNEAGCPLD